MTLPIVESILRGALRPNHIRETVSAEKQSLLMRQLRLAPERGNLKELEKDIINALGDLTSVTTIYEEGKCLKKAIAGLNKSNNSASYTRVYKSVLAGFMIEPPITSPTLRLYKTFLFLEKEHTIWTLVDLHTIMKDDSYIRPEIKKLLNSINGYCREANAWNEDMSSEKALIQNMLTELYFSLIQSFAPILYNQEEIGFDDDLENFVYQWKGKFPEKTELEDYQEKVDRIKKDNIAIRENQQMEDSSDSLRSTEQKKEHTLTKAEKFLQDTSQYEFLKMPKIVALDSNHEDVRKRKALKLIEIMMENTAHAAAMLDYLGLYKWIKDKYETKFTLIAYDQFCSKVVMGKEGTPFKNYRLSLNYEKDNFRKYHGHEYVERVKEEYQAVLNQTSL
nr:hypothetical protein [Prevotella sp.]